MSDMHCDELDNLNVFVVSTKLSATGTVLMSLTTPQTTTHPFGIKNARGT